jgi:hypothetical protein
MSPHRQQSRSIPQPQGNAGLTGAIYEIILCCKQIMLQESQKGEISLS